MRSLWALGILGGIVSIAACSSDPIEATSSKPAFDASPDTASAIVGSDGGAQDASPDANDGGTGECTSLAYGASGVMPVTLMQSPPDMTGGAIEDGTYSLITITAYASQPFTLDGSVGSTIRITGALLETRTSTSNKPVGYPFLKGPEAYTLEQTGKVLKFNRTCPLGDAGTGAATTQVTYSAIAANGGAKSQLKMRYDMPFPSPLNNVAVVMTFEKE